MENLYISPSNCTPEVKFEMNQGKLFFGGRSFPSDPVKFYKPIFDKLTHLLPFVKIENNLEVIFNLEYYNTSTSKQFARLFKILEDSGLQDDIKIKWYYNENDPDMKEAGVRFREFTCLDFEIKSNEDLHKN